MDIYFDFNICLKTEIAVYNLILNCEVYNLCIFFHVELLSEIIHLHQI